VIAAIVHVSMYLYAGVLNYETVGHTSSFLVYVTQHTYMVLNSEAKNVSTSVTIQKPSRHKKLYILSATGVCKLQ